MMKISWFTVFKINNQYFVYNHQQKLE